MDRCGIRIQLEVEFGDFFVGWGSDDPIDRLERESFQIVFDQGGNDAVVFVCF